ncbi:putative pre-16S rRNA nuclease [Alphaproteobacteria bacterium]|nr:putative pre-16S rRNA nuclease [Alphaproteobacteria bacterium]
MLITDITDLRCAKYKRISRALAIDYGNKRIGLAISDINWIISSPLEVVETSKAFSEVLRIANENSVGLIVIGAPKPLNGGEGGLQYDKVKSFAGKLLNFFEKKNMDINIVFWDERLSTVAANKTLLELEMNLTKRKQNLDKLAASFILQGLLNYTEFNM